MNKPRQLLPQFLRSVDFVQENKHTVELTVCSEGGLLKHSLGLQFLNTIYHSGSANGLNVQQLDQLVYYVREI